MFAQHAAARNDATAGSHNVAGLPEFPV